MKLFKLIFVLLVLTSVGGFAYFAFTDVPVEQEKIEKKIPNSRFFAE